MIRTERPTATMRVWRRGAQEGVGPPGGHGGLAQHPGQIGVAMPGGAVALLLGRRLPDARSVAGPGDQLPSGGNRLISTPISAMITCAAVRPTPPISSSRSAAGANGAIASSSCVQLGDV